LLTIDRLLCTGCAACVDACPTGALRLDEESSIPTLVSALCDECLACLEACSTGAIQRVTSPQLAPVAAGKIVEGEVVEGEALPAPIDSRRLAPQPPRLWTGLASSALTFVGSWLLPRAADALLSAVERRLAGGANSASLSRNGPMTRPAGRQRRQRRRRRSG
jgi:NAD-dependent dihydropyrimidine dehydrogenase PreA subunit